LSGNFLHNLLLFGRVLRKLGLDINPGRMMDLVSALDTSGKIFRYLMKLLHCSGESRPRAGMWNGRD
jgi:hypothetical protein